MRRVLVLALLLALTATSAMPVSAAPRTTTFHGSCVGYGTAVVSPAIGVVPQVIEEGTWRSQGLCTGTLDGRRVVDVPFRAEVDLGGLVVGCSASAGTAGGTIAFGRGDRQAIGFLADIAAVAADQVFVLRGTDGGLATGRKSALVHPGGTGCEEGLDRVSLTVQLTTLVPVTG
jgi:hypothetical protein